MLATTFQLFPSPFQDFFAIYLLKQKENTSSENKPNGANSESYTVNKKNAFYPTEVEQNLLIEGTSKAQPASSM